MAEDIKSLIEKIQQDGVIGGQERAREIEKRARAEAEAIIEKARQESESIREEAVNLIAQMEEKQRSLLAQAGRDALLLLRREINAMLDKLIQVKIKDTLTPELLVAIITRIVQAQESQVQTEVSLSREDLQALEEGFLSKLKDEIKKGLVLRASDDLRAGFVISFDAGKSAFDFSDQALGEYIGSYVKPKLAELLKGQT